MTPPKVVKLGAYLKKRVPQPQFRHLALAEALVDGLEKLAPGTLRAVVISRLRGPRVLEPQHVANAILKGCLLVGLYKLPVSALQIAEDIDLVEKSL